MLVVTQELHMGWELAYAGLKFDIWSINNWNLGTFTTDVQNSFRLAALLPKEACKVGDHFLVESHLARPNTNYQSTEQIIRYGRQQAIAYQGLRHA